MSAHDVAVLAERVSAVERHLARIASKLPASAGVYEAAQRGPSDLRAFLARVRDLSTRPSASAR